MADSSTEIAREFLELMGYAVRKETKFFKNKKQFGTASDIDIIASRAKELRIDGLVLGKNIVGETKNWDVDNRGTLDWIYEDKFRFIDNSKISWPQLKTFFETRSFDRVLFCLATTNEVFKYARKRYGITIVSAGLMIKQMARFFRESDHNLTYYSEWYNYNMLKTIMRCLYEIKWKDKVTLEDLVWIDPSKNSKYRNKFIEVNSRFLEEFVSRETDGIVMGNLLKRLPEKWDWKRIRDQLKSNRKFWSYLVKCE